MAIPPLDPSASNNSGTSVPSSSPESSKSGLPKIFGRAKSHTQSSLGSKEPVPLGRKSPQHQTFSDYGVEGSKAVEVVDRTLKRKSSSDPDYSKLLTATPAEIETALSYLLSMPRTSPFDVAKAEAELSQCIEKYPGSSEQIKAALAPVRFFCQNPPSDTLDNVLLAAMSKPKNAPFLCAYFKGGDVDDFAKKALQVLIQKESPLKIIAVLKHFSELDFQKSHRETMGRTSSLSSSLCREFGKLRWSKELGQLNQKVKEAMATHKLEKITLDKEYLKKHKPLISFKSDEDRTKTHALAYAAFAKDVLNALYTLPIPQELALMLIARRESVKEELAAKNRQLGRKILEQKNQSEARTYLSEALFLRIIIPEIVSVYPVQSDESKALIPLRAILKALAFETRYETATGAIYFDPQDRVQSLFNPLMADFEKTHLEFIEKNSLRERSPHKAELGKIDEILQSLKTS